MRNKKRDFIAIILGSIPWIAYVIVSPFFNKPKPLIAGMPPLMFWDTIWMALTSFCLFLAYIVEFGGR